MRALKIDVWVNADSSQVHIQCITQLIDLEVENADGAPEGGALAIMRRLVDKLCMPCCTFDLPCKHA